MVVLMRAGLLRYALPYYNAHTTAQTPIKMFSMTLSRKQLCRSGRFVFCSTLVTPSDLSVEYKHGRPVLAVPLPSRGETCLFFLRPMLTNVADFLRDVVREDPGVRHAAVLTTGGEQVAGATLMDALIRRDFQLLINDVTYTVRCPLQEVRSSERMTDMEDVKHLVHMFHTAMHLPTHHLQKEMELQKKRDYLIQELTPLEKAKDQISVGAERRSTRVLWTGLALMSVQGGALAWLTWWVYSWDIMEPVTYFLTYSTSIGIFAYYVLTKQEYIYPDAKDRQFLHYFYKGARKQHFNILRYNQLKEELALVEEDLRRVRNAIQLRLPVEQVQAKQ